MCVWREREREREKKKLWWVFVWFARKHESTKIRFSAFPSELILKTKEIPNENTTC